MGLTVSARKRVGGFLPAADALRTGDGVVPLAYRLSGEKYISLVGVTQMAGERGAATVAIITCAIQDRVCLRGTHVDFRVRFAPHALGWDENGRHSVFAFEFGGMTLGRAHWVHFVVDRLRALQRTADPWRTGSPEGRPKINLRDIEAAIDASWMRTI